MRAILHLEKHPCRFSLLISCFALSLLLFCSPAFAHPLGNDSITHFSVLYVLPDRVELDFLLDIAETKSVLIQRDEIDTDKDGKDTVAEQQAWLEVKAREFIPHVRAAIDGHKLTFELVDDAVDPDIGQKAPSARVVQKTIGFAGMPTYRLLIRYVAKYPDRIASGEHLLSYKDATYPTFAGLKRIILERTSHLFDVDVAHESKLSGPLVPEEIIRRFARVDMKLDPAARLVVTRPGDRWDIQDGDTHYVLYKRDGRLRIYRPPLVEFIEPHPEFWDEGVAPDVYEQYDPADLPQEVEAQIRFRVVPNDLPKPSAPAVELAAGPESQPAVGTAVQPDQSTGETAVAHAFPERYSGFASNDPAQAGKAQSQARQVIGLLTREGGGWSLGVILSVTALCFVWGAAHALMPGHAKTVVAAYLISQHGTYWHAAVLAAIVTFTHTALVVILGVVIWAYQATNPEIGPTLQTWLGILSGVLVAAMGATLVWRAVTGRIAHHHHDHDHQHHDDNRSWWRKLFTHSHPHVHQHEAHPSRRSTAKPEASAHHHRDHHHEHHHHGHHQHEHGHDHPHDHAHEHGHSHEHVHGHHHHTHDHGHPQHGHEHEHGHGHAHGYSHSHTHDHAHGHARPHTHAHADTAQTLSMRTLLILGVTGGIVPCPTATIIMLLGIGANVVAGALYAVGIFSLGLALTLMLVGSMALSSRKIAAKIMSDAQHEGELSGTGKRLLLQIVPALSGLVVIALGAAIAANYIHLMRNGTDLFTWLG